MKTKKIASLLAKRKLEVIVFQKFGFEVIMIMSTASTILIVELLYDKVMIWVSSLLFVAEMIFFFIIYYSIIYGVIRILYFIKFFISSPTKEEIKTAKVFRFEEILEEEKFFEKEIKKLEKEKEDLFPS